MKKVFVYMTACVLLGIFASSAMAVTGLDKFERPFGPKLKGIQLGQPVEVLEFINLANQFVERRGYYYNGNWCLVTYDLGEGDISITDGRKSIGLFDSTKKGKFGTPEYEQFLTNPRIALFPVKEESWNGGQYRVNPEWLAVKTTDGPFRIAAFTLPLEVLGAKGMSVQTIAQEMMNNFGIRSFRGMWGRNMDPVWVTDDSDNYKNGWEVAISTIPGYSVGGIGGENGGVRIRAATTSGSISFD
jgi:hypothetical protein